MTRHSRVNRGQERTPDLGYILAVNNNSGIDQVFAIDIKGAYTHGYIINRTGKAI